MDPWLAGHPSCSAFLGAAAAGCTAIEQIYQQLAQCWLCFVLSMQKQQTLPTVEVSVQAEVQHPIQSVMLIIPVWFGTKSEGSVTIKISLVMQWSLDLGSQQFIELL